MVIFYQKDNLNEVLKFPSLKYEFNHNFLVTLQSNEILQIFGNKVES